MSGRDLRLEYYDARFVQPTQRTWPAQASPPSPDRAHDTMRGGSAFDVHRRVRGFASFLCTGPNRHDANGAPAEGRAALLRYQDLIKVGLSGNLVQYRFTETDGK